MADEPKVIEGADFQLKIDGFQVHVEEDGTFTLEWPPYGNLCGDKPFDPDKLDFDPLIRHRGGYFWNDRYMPSNFKFHPREPGRKRKRRQK